MRLWNKKETFSPAIQAKPFYRPISLPFRQALSALYYAGLTKWKYFPKWALKAPANMKIAAGAVGMGCIGFPNHPVWEMTSACNMNCSHCHAGGGSPHPDELSTDDAKKMLREIASIDMFRMMVFTGGEPLVRPDIYELCEYSAGLNLPPVIATNATIITPETARRLRDCGVACLAVGLDSAHPDIHNKIRGNPHAFSSAVKGIENWRSLNMPLQINFTALKDNLDQVPDLLKMADSLGASIVLLYQLIPMGRGDEIKEDSLTREENRWLMETIYKFQGGLKTIVEPVGAPQWWPFLISRKESIFKKHMADVTFKGCVAGRGLCYIKPDGTLWPCPFLPIGSGNIRQRSLREIWEEGEGFSLLRKRENLKGKCGLCSYREFCGGCRGRAYAVSGDYLHEDPSCFLNQT